MTKFVLAYIYTTAVVYIILTVHVESFTACNLILGIYVVIVNAYKRGDCYVDVLIYLYLTVITMIKLFSSLIFSYVCYYPIRKCPLGKGRLVRFLGYLFQKP